MNIKSKKVTVSDGRFESDGTTQKTPIPGSYEIRVTKHITYEDDHVEAQTIQVIRVRPWIYLACLIGYAIFAATIVFAAVWWGNITEAFGWGGGALGLLVLHFMFSFSQVNENELSGVLFFGAPVREFSPGFVFHPLGLLDLKKLPKNPIQVQFPDDPEKVYKGDDDEYFKSLSPEERDKYVLPIRALTGKPSVEEKGEAGILNSQMTLEVTFYVRWMIEQFWLYLVTVGNQGETNRQFRDSGERVLIQEIATRTVGKVVEELHVINNKLASRFEDITQDYGVTIVETAMLSPDINHKVNKSLRDVVSAKATAVTTQISATAKRFQLTEEGMGEAAATQADLEALAAGAKALGLSGAEVLELEKARAMANGNATIIVDGGSGSSGLVGIGTRFGIGVNAAPKSPKEGESNV